MTTGNMNVSTFFVESIDRKDGKILIFSMLVCCVFAVFNYIDAVAAFLSLDNSNSRVATWAIWPIVQPVFYVHIRLAANGTDEFSYLIYCCAILFGPIVYFALDNWGVV